MKNWEDYKLKFPRPPRYNGRGNLGCIASEGDLFVLASFNQGRSVIYDSSGKFNVF